MASWNDDTGANMKTEKEILDMLNRTVTNLGVTVEQARAINALKILMEENDELRVSREELRAEVRAVLELVKDVLVAEYDGELHGANQKRAALRKHGLIK